MPFLEFKCSQCGHEFEELIQTGKDYPPCPKCGAKTDQKYSGQMWINKVSKNKCSGNCATCKGCK